MPSRVRSIHGSTAEPLPDVYRVLVSIVDQKPWRRLPTPPEEQAFKRIHHHTVTTTRFVPPLVDLAPFHRWNYGTKIALNCPFEQKDEAKARGARWDPKDKSWYVTDNMDLNPFKELAARTERAIRSGIVVRRHAEHGVAQAVHALVDGGSSTSKCQDRCEFFAPVCILCTLPARPNGRRPRLHGARGTGNEKVQVHHVLRALWQKEGVAGGGL